LRKFSQPFTARISVAAAGATTDSAAGARLHRQPGQRHRFGGQARKDENLQEAPTRIEQRPVEPEGKATGHHGMLVVIAEQVIEPANQADETPMVGEGRIEKSNPCGDGADREADSERQPHQHGRAKTQISGQGKRVRRRRGG
jgi:hypothetical protein